MEQITARRRPPSAHWLALTLAGNTNVTASRVPRIMSDRCVYSGCSAGGHVLAITRSTCYHRAKWLTDDTNAPRVS